MRARLTLPVLLLGSTLTVMAGAILAPVVGLIRSELELSGTLTGMVLTAHGASLALAGPLVAAAIERVGLRTTLSAGLVLYGVAGGAGLVTADYLPLIISRLLFGVGGAAVFVATTVALLDLFHGAARARAMGWRSAAISVGGLVWPLAGGALGTISWHAPFAVYLLGVPLGILAAVALPATPRRAATRGERGGIARLLRGRPELAAGYALQLVSVILLYVVLVFLPLRLAEVGVDSPVHVALCASGLSASMTVTGLVYARLRAAASDQALLALALATWVCALALLATTAAPGAMAAAAATFGVGMGLAVPTLTLVIGEGAPEALRSRATALLASVTFGGQILAPLLVGPLAAVTSIRMAFAVCAASAAAILVAMLAGRATYRDPVSE